MNDKYLISYHANTLTIQNWHGQSKSLSVPSLSCMKLSDYLILGTELGKILMYTLDGLLICTFEAHYQMISAIEVNQYYILTASSDGSVKVWYLDQVLSRSFQTVDEYMHSLGVTRIRLWNNTFYISSNDKHLKVYRDKLIEEYTFDHGIMDFDIGIYGICVCLSDGSVGTFKDNKFKLVSTMASCRYILWSGQNIICSSTSTCNMISLQGDLIFNKSIDNISGIALMPLFKTNVSKKDLPVFSRNVQPIEKLLCVEKMTYNSEEFIQAVLR